MEEIIIEEGTVIETLEGLLPDEVQRTEGLAAEEYANPEVPKKSTETKEGE